MGALAAGFGIETDLRDRDGVVVVSHDPPSSTSPDVVGLLEQWRAQGVLGRAPLALNIKSDGLLSMLGTVTRVVAPFPHFFFDMSFPQLLMYARAGLPVALRVSEFEPAPVHLVGRLGIESRYWLDGFDSDWWLENLAVSGICRTSIVTVVSPEIHGRDPVRVWEWFADRVVDGCDISICTDQPYEVLEACS